LRRLGRDAGLIDDRDEPALRVARLNFHDGPDQSSDERSPYGQGCFSAAMLRKAAASRDFCIDRFERLHAYQEAGRETVPRQSARIDRDQSSGRLPVPGELF
jgi:hypothetical protein